MTPQTVEDRIMHLQLAFFILDGKSDFLDDDPTVDEIVARLREYPVCNGNFDDLSCYATALSCYFLTGEVTDNGSGAGGLIFAVKSLADLIAEAHPVEYAENIAGLREALVERVDFLKSQHRNN